MGAGRRRRCRRWQRLRAHRKRDRRHPELLEFAVNIYLGRAGQHRRLLQRRRARRPRHFGLHPATHRTALVSGFHNHRSRERRRLGFRGSSPVVLPSIGGRQLVAFVPKDGNIFVLDSQNLGNFGTPLTLRPFADAFNNDAPDNDTKAAIAFLQTPDGRNILIVGADSNGSSLGGFAAFELDAAATPPTLTKLWQAPSLLRDSFGSPSVIANPVPDPSNPPSPIGLAWVIDGDGARPANDDFLQNCALRAYDVLTGRSPTTSTSRQRHQRGNPALRADHQWRQQRFRCDLERVHGIHAVRPAGQIARLHRRTQHLRHGRGRLAGADVHQRCQLRLGLLDRGERHAAERARAQQRQSGADAATCRDHSPRSDAPSATCLSTSKLCSAPPSSPGR